MEEFSVDIVVIGSGPAGQKAAIQASKFGKKVVIVEKDEYPGGACLNRGTIPSKTLREAILDLTRFHDRNFYGKECIVRDVSVNDLNHRLQKVFDEEREMVRRQFTKNNIDLLRGVAVFVDDHQIDVSDNDGNALYRLTADYILIATGSVPRHPIDVPFDGEVILDSTMLLSMDRVPKTMVVLGGGVIGSEYASFFAALGCEVTIVDKKDHLLPLLDHEIGMHLQKELTEIGLQFLGNKRPAEITRDGDCAHVKFEDGTTFDADVLLYALGRTANIEGLDIKKAGIDTDGKGYVPVNDLFQTRIPHIYAAGDVIGGPSLASTSMEQGRLAARHAFGAKIHRFPTKFPLGIYTIPEISTCGYTEEQLKKMNFHYEVGRAYYWELARGHISGSTRGLVKVIFHAETLEILGVHIIGRNATELIHIGQVAMSFNAHVDYFIDQVFNYPTFAEGYRVAALNGMNKIKHRR